MATAMVFDSDILRDIRAFHQDATRADRKDLIVRHKE
jgi:hypothetical protein